MCLAVCRCVSGSITQKDEKSQNLRQRKSDSLEDHESGQGISSELGHLLKQTFLMEVIDCFFATC